jgi:hypothetical protein
MTFRQVAPVAIPIAPRRNSATTKVQQRNANVQLGHDCRVRH